MRRYSLLILLLACGGDRALTESGGHTDGIAPPPGARAEFTHYPVDLTPDGTIEPLGHLAPPGHTLPTTHVYIYSYDYDAYGARDTATRNVYAPATGVIWFMMQPIGTDWKIMFQTTKTFAYYLDHMWPRPGLKLNYEI